MFELKTTFFQIGLNLHQKQSLSSWNVECCEVESNRTEIHFIIINPSDNVVCGTKDQRLVSGGSVLIRKLLSLANS